jgi:hypothetical protein
MGGLRVMTASGTYQQSGSRLSFNPRECSFSSPELGQTVKFFPIPTDTPTEDSTASRRLEAVSRCPSRTQPLVISGGSSQDSSVRAFRAAMVMDCQ